MENTAFSLVLERARIKLMEGFNTPLAEIPYEDAWQVLLNQVAGKMQDNYPYFSPMYAGQMLKPPHPVAAMAYQLAMIINPNNHALDGGKASSAMEKEVVTQLAAMFGWKTHLGHLTGGGTMANLEALWIAGELHPGKYVVASEAAHYTHQRISGVLKLPFKNCAANSQGVMDLDILETWAKKGKIGTVICTMGTTGTGAVDPLPEILKLKAQYGFRIHADAAYGGYFRLANSLAVTTCEKFRALEWVDSLVIDPHKHGLQPYGCGCILWKDPAMGKYYHHDSPYTYFTSDDLHLGEISLECSRPGAAAVALWATMEHLPLVTSGVFAAGMDRCHLAAMKLWSYLEASDHYLPLMVPETDIILFAGKEKDTAAISETSQQLFAAAENSGLYLALIAYPVHLLPSSWDGIEKNSPSVTLLRSCLMKHTHLDWIDRIWEVLMQIHPKGK